MQNREVVNQLKILPATLDWDAWFGPAPEQPCAATRRRGWHYLGDFGNGQLGNQGVHQMDTDHFRNWLAAVRSRKSETLTAEIEEGHLSSALCHLANIAQRTGRTRRALRADQFSAMLGRELCCRPVRLPLTPKLQYNWNWTVRFQGMEIVACIAGCSVRW